MAALLPDEKLRTRPYDPGLSSDWWVYDEVNFALTDQNIIEEGDLPMFLTNCESETSRRATTNA